MHILREPILCLVSLKTKIKCAMLGSLSKCVPLLDCTSVVVLRHRKTIVLFYLNLEGLVTKIPEGMLYLEKMILPNCVIYFLGMTKPKL